MDNLLKEHKDDKEIAELSRVQRPTELAGMYRHLFENEWKDAFNELTQNGHSATEAVDTLRLTLLVKH